METESNMITKEEVIVLCYKAGIPLAFDRKLEQPSVHTTFPAIERLCNFVRLKTISEIKDLMNDNPMMEWGNKINALTKDVDSV